MTSDQTKILLEAQRQLMEGDATLAPVLKLLDKEGYKLYHHPAKSQCYSFQKRVDDGLHYLCGCNEKLFIHVNVTHQSIEMHMTRETSEKNWFTLSKVHGIEPNVFPDYYGRGLEKIMSSWKTVYKYRGKSQLNPTMSS